MHYSDLLHAPRRLAHRVKLRLQRAVWSLLRPCAALLPLERLRHRDEALFFVIRLVGKLLTSYPEYRVWREFYHLKQPFNLSGKLRLEQRPRDGVNHVQLRTSDDPLVSIIVSTNASGRHLLWCLKSIEKHPPLDPFEVIFVEDQESDLAHSLEGPVEGLRLRRVATNSGPTGCLNLGADWARGRYILFLDANAAVTAGAIDSLLEVMKDTSDVGIVGAKLASQNGKLIEAGARIDHNARIIRCGVDADPLASPFNYRREVDCCARSALLIDRQLFESVQRFDEGYPDLPYQDADLAYRVRECGRRVIYQPEALVIVDEAMLPRGVVRADPAVSESVSRSNFAVRWKERLPVYQGTTARFQSLPSRALEDPPTILVMDHSVPRPDHDAGSKTMVQFITALQSLGFSIKLWPDTLYYDAVYTRELQRLGIEVFYGPEYCGKFESWIRANADRVSVVLLSRPQVALSYLPILKRSSRAKIVYYGHDIHYLRLATQAELDPLDQGVRAAQKLYAIKEPEIWSKVDLVYYPSQEEVEVVRQYAAESHSTAIARAIPGYAYDDLPQGTRTGLAERRDILFVGGFGHPPNQDAALWFKHEVFPLIRLRHPHTRLILAGSQPTPEVLALADDSTLVTGFVSDVELARLYLHTRVAVAPLRFGAGVKGKVVEAFRFGLPIVTTGIGLQGLPQSDGIVSLADRADEFAEAVCELLVDDELWLRRNALSQAYVRQHFSSQALRQIFEEDLPRLTGARVSEPYPSKVS